MDLSSYFPPPALVGKDYDDPEKARDYILKTYGDTRSSVVDKYVNSVGLLPSREGVADLFVNSGLSSYDFDWRNTTASNWTEFKKEAEAKYGKEAAKQITAYAKGLALQAKDSKTGKTIAESTFFKGASDPEVQKAVAILLETGGDPEKLKEAGWDAAKAAITKKGSEYAGEALAYAYREAAGQTAYKEASAWIAGEGAKYAEIAKAASATYYVARQQSLTAKAAYAGAGFICAYYGQSPESCQRALSAVVAFARGQIDQKEFEKEAGKIVGAAAAVTACAMVGAAVAAPICGYVGGVLGGEAAKYTREIKDFVEGTLLGEIPGVSSLVEVLNKIESGIVAAGASVVGAIADVLGL